MVILLAVPACSIAGVLYWLWSAFAPLWPSFAPFGSTCFVDPACYLPACSCAGAWRSWLWSALGLLCAQHVLLTLLATCLRVAVLVPGAAGCGLHWASSVPNMFC
jgi:hypothetical protein